MQESEWVHTLGDAALRRAQEEGYQVRRGIAERFFELLQERTDMEHADHSRWLDHGERTSPRAESFASRDTVLREVRDIPLPEGWRAEVSRIVRVTVSGTFGPLHFTGVVVELRGPDGALVARKALDFEGLLPCTE